MKKKAVSLALLCALVLAACVAPAEEKGMEILADPVAAVTSPAESAPEIHTEAEFSPPTGQQRAIDAYQEIIDFFVTPRSPKDPNYPGYPDGFADAYIGEDNYLYVCLTDTEGPEKMKYLRAVSEPQILKFVEVEHSYNDLYALQMALAEIEGLEFSFIGVDVTGNKVDLGIPDIGKKDAILDLLEEQLPEEVKIRFDQLPISIEESPYATFG